VGKVTGILPSCLIAIVAQDPSFFLFFVLVSPICVLCFVFCIGEVFLILASFFYEACLGLFPSLPPSPPRPSSSFSSGFVWLRNEHSLSLRLSLAFFLSFSRLHSFFSQPLLFFSLSSFLLGGGAGCFFFPLQQLSLLQPIVIACQ
jgi:hypothetical protein